MSVHDHQPGHQREGGERRHQLVGRLDLWPMKRAFQLAFLQQVGLRPGDYLLDLGCGTLRGGIPMIEFLDVGHYVGLDVRPELDAEARAELMANGLAHKRPQLYFGQSIGSVESSQDFDVVWAFSVVMHMTDAILLTTLTHVARVLKPDGRMFANVHIGERHDGAWREFPVAWRPLDFYEASADTAGLAVEDLGVLRTLGHVSGVSEQDEQHMLCFEHR